MKQPRQQYSSIKALMVLQKPQLLVKDLEVIHGCGKVTAINKRKEFDRLCKEKGLLVSGIPTDIYIELMGINVNRIEQYAKKMRHFIGKEEAFL